jgi:hypothetical protein
VSLEKPKRSFVQAEGEGLKKGVLGRECRFMIYVKDHLGEPHHLVPSDDLRVVVQAPDNQKVSRIAARAAPPPTSNGRDW